MTEHRMRCLTLTHPNHSMQQDHCPYLEGSPNSILEHQKPHHKRVTGRVTSASLVHYHWETAPLGYVAFGAQPSTPAAIRCWQGRDSFNRRTSKGSDRSLASEQMPASSKGCCGQPSPRLPSTTPSSAFRCLRRSPVALRSPAAQCRADPQEVTAIISQLPTHRRQAGKRS